MMNRDWDLVRALLIAIAEEQRPGARLAGTELAIEGYEPAVVAGHLMYMNDDALVEAKEYRAMSAVEHELGSIMVLKILPKGHDLLDAIRADNVWAKTKERLRAVGGTASLEVVKNVAVTAAMGLLGLSS